MSNERDKTGRFLKGHKGMGGRPKVAEGQQVIIDIDAEVERERKRWVEDIMDIIKDSEIPSFADGFMNNLEMIYRAMLELRSKQEMSANDVDRLNKLSNSFRYSLNDLIRYCERERKWRAING